MKMFLPMFALLVTAMPAVAQAETEFVGGFRVLSQSANCRGNYLQKGAVSPGSYHPVGVGGNRNDSLTVQNSVYGESVYQATARFASGNRPTATNAKVSGLLIALGRYRTFQAGVAIASAQISNAGGAQFAVVRGSIANPFADPGQNRKPCILTFVGSYAKRP